MESSNYKSGEHVPPFDLQVPGDQLGEVFAQGPQEQVEISKQTIFLETIQNYKNRYMFPFKGHIVPM